MELTVEQRKRLCRELITVFGTAEKLNDFAFVYLGETTEAKDITAGVVELVRWAGSDGVEELLKVVLQEFPRNSNLKALDAELTGSEETAAKPESAFPSERNFDLVTLVSKAYDAVPDRTGVVGLAIPCKNDHFVNHFCVRLQEKIGASQVHIAGQVLLDPLRSPVEIAVRGVKQNRQMLRDVDVLCPVRLQVDPAEHSDLCALFWQQVCAEFPASLSRRLIIILLGAPGTPFPPQAISLPEPVFEREHIRDWINDVRRMLRWTQSFEHDWVKCFLQECSIEGDVRIDLVYQHLGAVLHALRQCPSSESFYQYMYGGM